MRTRNYMKPVIIIVFLLCMILLAEINHALSRDGFIPRFELTPNDLMLQRLAQPGIPFDKTGRKFAILGDESGSFEAWAYPIKLFRNFTFSFLLNNATTPLQAKDLVRYISVAPEATIITYTYQSFTVKAIYVIPVNEPGGLILLEVDSNVPLTIICGFLPVLQPMWPAGLGGQYAYWSNEHKAYIISESARKNHGMVGCPAAASISSTPAHMLSDVPNEFKIEIPEPEKVRNSYIPVIISGESGEREKVIEYYHRLSSDPEYFYLQNLEYYKALRLKTLRIQTPSQALNLAFEWAKVSMDNLMVENPTLGTGLVAGLTKSGISGRPGFGWYFGGDAFINILAINSYGDYNLVKNILLFNQKWQRNDGKMAHELSQAEGYIDWWNDYHYGYIHGDTTPFYIVAFFDYFRSTGDLKFLKESWKSLQKAYEWCLSTDVNGDGLMDNVKAGLGGVEFGAFTGVETDIYLAAVWTRAAYAMQQLARVVGDDNLDDKSRLVFQQAEKALNDKFWDENQRAYAYAFNASGERLKDISPYLSLTLMWELGTSERSFASLELLNSANYSTDWGVRGLSEKSALYNPLNYNYGTVWPFITGFFNTALFKHHFNHQGYSMLEATAGHTFDHSLGNISELFSGGRNVWLQETVAHQGFSTAGLITPLVRGLFGLTADAQVKEIYFAPNFPANWQQVSFTNYLVDGAAFSCDYENNTGELQLKISVKNAKGFKLSVSPAFGIGTVVREVLLDGVSQDFDIKDFSQVMTSEIRFPVSADSHMVVFRYNPTLEIIPPQAESQTGDVNKGLKIISMERLDNILRIELEGLAGGTYRLPIKNADILKLVSGGVLDGESIVVHLPAGNPIEFIQHKLLLELK